MGLDLSDPDVGFPIGLGAAVVLCFGICCGAGIASIDEPKPSAFDKGRCIGWAEAQGLTPAWDDEGRCVLGAHPAEEAP